MTIKPLYILLIVLAVGLAGYLIGHYTKETVTQVYEAYQKDTVIKTSRDTIQLIKEHIKYVNQKIKGDREFYYTLPQQLQDSLWHRQFLVVDSLLRYNDSTNYGKVHEPGQ